MRVLFDRVRVFDGVSARRCVCCVCVFVVGVVVMVVTIVLVCGFVVLSFLVSVLSFVSLFSFVFVLLCFWSVCESCSCCCIILELA